MSYRVHQFTLDMSSGRQELEAFLNGMEGEIIGVLPNVIPGPNTATTQQSVLVIERLATPRRRPPDFGERVPEEIAVP